MEPVTLVTELGDDPHDDLPERWETPRLGKPGRLLGSDDDTP